MKPSDLIAASQRECAIAQVAQDLGLRPHSHPDCPSASILTNELAIPIAALAEQACSLTHDRRAIETLKAADPRLPIIFISRTTRPRRETAIRRLGIHYFLAHPMKGEELKLVLEALVKTASSAARHARFCEVALSESE